MFDFKSPTESKLEQTILEAEKWKWSMFIQKKNLYLWPVSCFWNYIEIVYWEHS